MSEPRKQGATGVWAASILAGLLALPFVYLLLLGPVVFLIDNDMLSVDVWEVVAEPAAQLGRFLGFEPKIFWESYERYLNWWASIA